jgi:hypothetical protein
VIQLKTEPEMYAEKKFLVFGCSFLFPPVLASCHLNRSIGLVGIWDSTQKCHIDQTTGQQVCTVNYGILFVMFISYFFTHQVLQNSVRVTVAGVTGTWWFTPEEAMGCCSSGVINSAIRYVAWNAT